ncbi:hypothetical protein RSOLAG22IIIB_06819 [Rhizoctonia solani]|uniref:Uncharacterized protein n=1 Tax=Rhizoctonia solani TaxID=456999 RepID=A0A0K6GGU6_9AGAM|nr:hypothetical protein RSOLAG22IIIB_06819 [Rhizoctonia solani]
MPGVRGSILTFLHGPHACIGYRFALQEMKTLYALVCTFEFTIDPRLGEDREITTVVSSDSQLHNTREDSSNLPSRVYYSVSVSYLSFFFQ